MDLFYRGYDPDARITSGAKHLSAAATRFAVSIVLSIPHLPDSVWEQVKRLLTVHVLWSLCLVFAGWVIATVVGGLIGLAVNAILIAYGLVDLWEQIKATSGDLRDWAMGAYQAQSDAELDTAAQHFAVALTKGGITILEVVVTHRVFRAVEGKLRDRFPTPEGLSKRYEQAAKQREEAGRPREKTPAEKAKSAAEKVAEVVTGGVRYEGGKRAAEDFPTAAVALTGAVLAVGTVAIAAWASSAGARKGQP